MPTREHDSAQCPSGVKPQAGFRGQRHAAVRRGGTKNDLLAFNEISSACPDRRVADRNPGAWPPAAADRPVAGLMIFNALLVAVSAAATGSAAGLLFPHVLCRLALGRRRLAARESAWTLTGPLIHQPPLNPGQLMAWGVTAPRCRRIVVGDVRLATGALVAALHRA